MNPEFKASMELNKAVTDGMDVEVRWTNNGHNHRANGVVAKVNAQTVRVRLIAAIYAPKYNKDAVNAEERWTRGELLYDAGREISVPRCTLGSAIHRWSVNNGVFPRRRA
jgi:hypothetical protein